MSKFRDHEKEIERWVHDRISDLGQARRNDGRKQMFWRAATELEWPVTRVTTRFYNKGGPTTAVEYLQIKMAVDRRIAQRLDAVSAKINQQEDDLNALRASLSATSADRSFGVEPQLFQTLQERGDCALPVGLK